jgi:flagellar motor switch/type III secretory pathway protein FliN
VVVTIDNKPQFLSFNPARNSSTDENKSPLISVTLVNEGEAPEVLLTLVQGETVLLENVIMTPNSEDAHTFEYQTGTLEDGLHTATVVVTRADSLVNSMPIPLNILMVLGRLRMPCLI